MKNRFKLSIPTPCHEKWENFTPAQKGSFCAQCKKEVIDFTGFSEQEIQHYFANTTGNTCGRFRDDQLKTYIAPRENSGRSKLLHASLFSATVILSGANAAPPPSHTKIEIVDQQSTATESPNNFQGDRIIKGIVLDAETRKAIPGVAVGLKNSAIGIITDAQGKFTLTIQHQLSTHKLVFSLFGFETVAVQIPASGDITVLLKRDIIYIPEIVITTPAAKKETLTLGFVVMEPVPSNGFLQQLRDSIFHKNR